MLSNHEPFCRGRHNAATTGVSAGAVALTECESIELLLLRNRGVIDAPEMQEFDSSVVTGVFLEILRVGYLRSLDSIPAMQSYALPYTRYVFSAAGRIRFYQLERLCGASGSGNQPGDPPARTSS